MEKTRPLSSYDLSVGVCGSYIKWEEVCNFCFMFVKCKMIGSMNRGRYDEWKKGKWLISFYFSIFLFFFCLKSKCQLWLNNGSQWWNNEIEDENVDRQIKMVKIIQLLVYTNEDEERTWSWYSHDRWLFWSSRLTKYNQKLFLI